MTKGHPLVAEVAQGGGGGPLRPGTTYAEALRRPDVTGAMLLASDPALNPSPEAMEQAELSIKYDGYIRRQEEEAKKLKKYEGMLFRPTSRSPPFRVFRRRSGTSWTRSGRHRWGRPGGSGESPLRRSPS